MVFGPVTAGASFWQFPPMLLAGSAAAGGIALINSIGSFSGWVAPFAIGWLRDVTGTTSSGLYVVAGLEMLAGLLILLFVPHGSREPQYQKESAEFDRCLTRRGAVF
ncbi:MAG TPA: hypothetical protein VFB92_07295 [Vicinamibacterales bacterium]|nr:hypothetical protein [Vicinamibacterales bacterium]